MTTTILRAPDFSVIIPPFPFVVFFKRIVATRALIYGSGGNSRAGSQLRISRCSEHSDDFFVTSLRCSALAEVLVNLFNCHYKFEHILINSDLRMSGRRRCWSMLWLKVVRVSYYAVLEFGQVTLTVEKSRFMGIERHFVNKWQSWHQVYYRRLLGMERSYKIQIRLKICQYKCHMHGRQASQLLVDSLCVSFVPNLEGASHLNA